MQVQKEVGSLNVML